MNDASKYFWDHCRSYWLDNPVHLKAFDIIAPKFPELDRMNEGIALTDFGLSIPEARIAVEILDELNCDCFFIIPHMYIPKFRVGTTSTNPSCWAQYRALAITRITHSIEVMQKVEPVIANAAEQEMRRIIQIASTK
jgi:hypothetical protein